MIPLAAVMVMGMGTGSVLAVKQTHRQNFSEEQLQILEQARELFQSGNRAAGEALLEEAGIEKPQKRSKGNHASQDDREAVKVALDANDYEAFIAVAQDGPFGDDVTEEIFEVLVEAHQLRQEGDREGARDVIEDAGIERGPRGDKDRGQRSFSQLTEEQQEVVRALGNDREAIKAYFEDEGIERGR